MSLSIRSAPLRAGRTAGPGLALLAGVLIGGVLIAGAPFAAPAAAQSVPTPSVPPAPPAPPAPAHPSAPRIVVAPVQREIIVRRVVDDSTFRNRATLGMSLSATGTRRDTLGVFVTRVVPGGPAEQSGIIEGDRIAAVNGVDLRLNPADADDPYAAGLPAHRLTRTVTQLKPGNTVSLRVYSNGRYRDVSATTGRMSEVYHNRSGSMLSVSDVSDMVGMVGMQLDRIGPELDRLRPQLERIGPMVRESVERAIDSLPRDIHIELQRARESEPDGKRQ